MNKEELEIEIRKLEYWILSNFVIALGVDGIKKLDELRQKLRDLAGVAVSR